MKTLILFLFVLTSVSAQADQPGSSTRCKAVSRETGNSSPFVVTIDWGVKTPGPGDLPPYFEHARQQARVSLTSQKEAASYDVSFEVRSGTTRCHWYKTLLGEIENVAKIEFHTLTAQSCGSAGNSSTIAFGEKVLDLRCE